MPVSKKRRAKWEMEQEAERKLMESIYPPKPPQEPPTWTDLEIGKLDRMEAIVNKLRYESVRDFDLISEFLQLSYLFEGASHRVNSLALKSNHYKTLKQYAAKEKQWESIHGTLAGLSTDLMLLRNTRDRRGKTPQ